MDIDGIWRRQFFSVAISSKDVVVQKIQEIEISSAFQTACIFGDRRPYRRRASWIWRNAGLERLPPRWVLFDWYPITGGVDLAAATGADNGGGSQITLLSRASTDQQPHASGSSTKTPEPGNAAASECVPSLLSKSMSMIPIAPQKPEHGHGAVVGDDKQGDDPTSECF